MNRRLFLVLTPALLAAGCGAASARFSMTLTEKDREHPRTVKSSGEMTFTSATEGTYRVTDYDSSAMSPVGLSGPFRITR